MWHHLPRQQQRGAQFDPGRKREPPAEAVEGREAQDHDYADIQTSPDGEPATGIDYPADPIERRQQDITPDDPKPSVNWDTRVEPERVRTQDETRGD